MICFYDFIAWTKNMRGLNRVNTYIDTLGIRCECSSKVQRDSLFNSIIDFLKDRNIVGIRYNKERSNQYYQITELLHANSKLATIARGYFKKDTLVDPDYYYININFYGLKRYSKKDDASLLLVRTIMAFLNTNNVYYRPTEIDFAMDIKWKIEHIVAVCICRSPNVDYYPIGDKHDDSIIQDNVGTYYIEKFDSYKRKKNAMSRAYLYDKRQKEIEKYNRDIGFDLTRFELKLQKRFFVKNEFNFITRYKALQKYTVLYFRDLENKEQFICQYNKAHNSKRRKIVLQKAIEKGSTVVLQPQMKDIGEFLRDIETIKLNPKGEFLYTKHEEYLECFSKFKHRY